MSPFEKDPFADDPFATGSTVHPHREAAPEPAEKKRRRPAPVGTMTCSLMKKLGWWIDSCQSYNAHINKKRDLFGLFDYVAVHRTLKLVAGIQTSTIEHRTGHIEKALVMPELALWLESGCAAYMHLWAAPGKWVGEKRLWTLVQLTWGMVDGKPAIVLEETFTSGGAPVVPPKDRKKPPKQRPLL